MGTKKEGRRFAVCVHNRDYSAALELRKIYAVVPDEEASAQDQVRIIDESGEDYLYPKKWFVPISLPPRLKRLLLRST